MTKLYVDKKCEEIAMCPFARSSGGTFAPCDTQCALCVEYHNGKYFCSLCGDEHLVALYREEPDNYIGVTE